ncbi:ligase [Bifidobacterium sp. UTCIF-37]|uniref:depupylase/deamidase Dop n=1 Tax=unclassified Bifidobacterium TaxID=2608897 RepID=UPI001126FFD7|nr:MULTISPECIES: depupylase/deamidase Dop [unclassified Bifidobacterium]TPF86444.1 ligase [Bifidobacterium sp. UTCIF-37]TPF89394.1 ligase [Bifidobacterium sp. UTCIF-38]
MSVRRVMGTETEYAVSQPGEAYGQPVKLSFTVVGAAADDATRHIRWDYRQEDPVNDARGTRLDRASARPEMLTDSPQLNITNVIAPNGGRIYVDHAHPEYSAPETTDPFEALAYDHAGDRLMLAAARAASAQPQIRDTGRPIVLHRNNVDGKGASWGTHENYMMARAVPFTDVAALMTAHFISRQIWAGSGRVGLGEHSETAGFQLSQRADYIHARIGLQTTFDRPIINTRDESHSTSDKRRLHVIVGDANRMDVPQVLKLGVTSMLLWTLEHARDAGYDLDALLGRLQLADPVEAMHVVSHDLSLDAALPLETGGETSAWLMQIELRRAVYEVAAAILGTDTKGEPAWEDRQTRNVMAMWGQALADVAAIRHADDDARLTLRAEAGRIEWLLKWQLLEKLRRKIAGAGAGAGDTGWGDPRLAAVDLSWAALDPAASVFAKLEKAGRVERLVDDDRLAAAASEPPSDTRAWLRAAIVRAFPSDVVAASWSHLTVRVPREDGQDLLADTYGNSSAAEATSVRPGDLVSLDMSDPLAFRRENVESVVARAANAAEAIGELAARGR